MADVMHRTNLVPNPRPAVDTYGWVSSAPATNTLAYTIDGADGLPCLELIDTAGGGGAYTYSLTVPETSTDLNPTVGQYIALGVDVKALDPEFAALFTLGLQGYSGTTVALAGAAPAPISTTDYTRRTVVGEVTADGGYARILISTTAYIATPGNGVRFRNAVMAVADDYGTALSSVETYFDGDTPSGPGVVNRWTGQPNASASEQFFLASGATRGAWAVELGDVILEGGDGILPALLARYGTLNGIVGCLTEPPDGLGLPPRRTQDVTLAQRDGVAMLSDFYENRIITLKAVIGGGGCEGCPTAKQNVRALLRAWARYCNRTSILTVFTDCNGQGDVADVGPYFAIGRGRAAEVRWLPGGVQVAEVTLRFDCVDHLLRFNPDLNDQDNVTQTVEVPVLSEFWVNYFADPRGDSTSTAPASTWTWDASSDEVSSRIAVQNATDGWPVRESGGGMELDGATNGGETAQTYYRRRVTTAGSVPTILYMNSTATSFPVGGMRVYGRAWIRSNRAVGYTARVGVLGAGSSPIGSGTFQPGVWTLVEGSHVTTLPNGTTARIEVTLQTPSATLPADFDFGGVVIERVTSAGVFFDGTPSFTPDYNQPGGFGWVGRTSPLPTIFAGSQFSGAVNASPSVVGLEERVPVVVQGDTCVSMEVQFEGPLTAPITLMDVTNRRWVRYNLDVAAGERAVLDTSTGRISHGGASASGDTSYALEGDTFMNLDPLTGQTPTFQLWTGDMTNDTGLARIFWSDAVLGI